MLYECYKHCNIYGGVLTRDCCRVSICAGEKRIRSRCQSSCGRTHAFGRTKTRFISCIYCLGVSRRHQEFRPTQHTCALVQYIYICILFGYFIFVRTRTVGGPKIGVLIYNLHIIRSTLSHILGLSIPNFRFFLVQRLHQQTTANRGNNGQDMLTT